MTPNIAGIIKFTQGMGGGSASGTFPHITMSTLLYTGGGPQSARIVFKALILALMLFEFYQICPNNLLSTNTPRTIYSQVRGLQKILRPYKKHTRNHTEPNQSMPYQTLVAHALPLWTSTVPRIICIIKALSPGHLAHLQENYQKDPI